MSSRRRFLRTSAAATAALFSSAALEGTLARIARGVSQRAEGFGPLVADPRGLLDLPAGFDYVAFSSSARSDGADAAFQQMLANGDPVPCRHDGMGAFAGPDGATILVRNHEVDPEHGLGVDPRRARPWDPQGKGGTTTLWVDRDRRLTRSFASLSGTFRNCAGGVTPWGSWLTCEECTYTPGPPSAASFDQRSDVSKRHGYVFEVPAAAEGLVEPVPILGMGRFYHEAVAVDAATGHVYMSEDRDDGLLYRYRPAVLADGRVKPGQLKPGDLAKGGTLEALRIAGRPQEKTQNWQGGETAFVPGRAFKVDWVAIPDLDPDVDMERDPTDHEPDPLKRRPRTSPRSIRAQGFALGATQFARVEGVTANGRNLYFCATSGGALLAGQVWKLDCARQELSLVVEPNDRALLEGPDNLVVAPNGDLVVCEDGKDDDFVVGVTREGRLYRIARNAHNDEEFAGACFSHDGQTLFVNIQEPGITLAIRGPWSRRHV
jgi:secreted PhoX family phosphatase